MASSNHPLSPDDRAMLSMRADEFQVALTRGSPGDWNPYLEGLTGTVRRAVLTELAVIEMAHRWDSGEQPTLEEYVARFPELGPTGSEPTELVEEFERRREQAENALHATQHSKRQPSDEPDFQPTRTVLASGPPKLSGPVGGFGGEGVVAVAQQYELIRELGRGAFGEVWLARKMPSGIEKAVKILHQPADEEVAQRELRSLELIKNLRHPYLLATEDFWVANNRLYIVTELADISLRKRLLECKEEGLQGIPEDELFVYMLEAADGFDFLHSKLITHRDVKPDNILIVNGHAKVADFGLARASESNVAQMSFAGTPAYMAPEVWGGEGGPPSDLYGFAMSYIELRQGSTPFAAGRVMEVMQIHLSGAYNFAEFIEEPERDVLRRALARDPAQRYPSCLAFVEDLASALGRQIHRKSGGIPQPRPRVATANALQSNVDTGFLNATMRTQTVLEKEPPLRPRFSRKLMAGIGVVLLAAVGVTALAVKDCGGPSGLIPDGGGPDGNGLPPGTAPDGEKTVELAGGRRVPEWIVMFVNAEPVRFRLIRSTNGPAPFYISQSKIWNRLFNVKNNKKREEPGGEDAPALSMTAAEAMAFAESLGGRLPTPEEWDWAAGFFDQQEQREPLKAGGAVRINSDKPGPTHGAGTDLAQNQFGLIDMAGNGREWTSGVLEEKDGRKRMILRGRNFTLTTALTYAELDSERKDEPRAQFADVASPYTGFRVVLPLP
jgi:serine/threonine protein kinase